MYNDQQISFRKGLLMGACVLLTVFTPSEGVVMRRDVTTDILIKQSRSTKHTTHKTKHRKSTKSVTKTEVSTGPTTTLIATTSISIVPSVGPSSTAQMTSVSISTSTSFTTSVAPNVSVSEFSTATISATPFSKSSSIAAPELGVSSSWPANAASATAIIIPTPLFSTLLGVASSSPASQYLPVATQALPTLSANDLKTVIDPSLQHSPMWNGTGTNTVTDSRELQALQNTVSYSRDQGKGGMVNGHYLFIFADTMTYAGTTATTNGTFNGAVSNSVTIDVGRRAASGQAPILHDPAGAMKGPKGALRGFVPFTEGEAAYNQQNGQGSRYAIWPEMGLIPLTSEISLMYAPIVFQNITNGGVNLRPAGTTLVTVSVPTIGGPVADRVAPLLFTADEIQFGCLGGLRSYGSDGVSGGKVYVFGNVKTGLLLGRTDVGHVADSSAYEWYYPSEGWTVNMPARGSQSCFANGTFSSVDIFYSPRHLTFLMIFMDGYADNRIQWRYLMSPPVVPIFAGGNASDIGNYLSMGYRWSAAQVLLEVAKPPVGYAYGGGAQLGYFGADDISRGGSQMLVSWTWPNGAPANTMAGGLRIQAAVVTWA